MKIKITPLDAKLLIFGFLIFFITYGISNGKAIYEDYQTNRLIEKINKIGTEKTTNEVVPEYDKNAYIEVSPEEIKQGESISFTYGYFDKTNNEHLSTATTVITVQAPSGVKFITINSNADTFPDDFIGANTNEEGVYMIDVERRIMRIDGKEDILFRAINAFIVDDGR